MWYYGMPQRIICQEGTHFSTACQVKVPCGVKIDVVWYWSPENLSNATQIITDSSNARLRALHSQATTCTNNSVMLHHLYTLTLSGLTSENAGLYWCQLKTVRERESSAATRNLLPSDKCYIGVEDTLTGCEYGKHTDDWRCAQNQTSSIAGGDSEESFYSKEPLPELLVTFKPSPTLEPLNDKDTPTVNMNMTIMEIVLFALVLLCISVIVLMLVCLISRRRRRRAGNV